MVVAAFGRWHEHHATARDAVSAASVLLAPVAVECFSVLTRFPSPHRAPPALVLEFLAVHFVEPPVALSAGDYTVMLQAAARLGIVGGAVYDAVVAATSRHAGATLVSLDQRAARTYQAVGVEHRLLP